MAKTIKLFSGLLLLTCICSCNSKPSEKDISKKLLLEYVCNETAKVNNLEILKTEETESTGQPPIFHFTVRGEVEWPNGCQEFGSNTPPGTKEKFERLVTLYKTDEGKWE
ncbi:MAG TPA: hypothetical protein VER36_08650 [Flavisolibacter sp.]|nr:hypothetical protein [Flavisolibacter sp.]